MFRIPLNLILLKFLVKIDKNHTEDPESDNRNTIHGGDDSITLAVTIIFQTPNIRASDVAELTEGVYDGKCYGPLSGRSRKRGTDPGIEDDEAGVGACLEKEGDVTSCRVQSGHADYEPDQTHENWNIHVPELIKVGRLVQS